jgi:regulatory protein
VVSRRGPESPPFHSGPPPTSFRESSGTGVRRVTALREVPRRPGRYRLEVDGEPVGLVSAEEVGILRLAVGRVLGAPEFESLRAAIEVLECFDRAVAALARRGRSRVGLERWLRSRGHRPVAILPAMQRLERLGLLDDAAFARGLARTRLESGRFGRHRVSAELLRAGVDGATARAVLAEFDETLEDEETRVREAADRRARSLSGLPADRAERRLAAWLVRRGFGAGAARREARRRFGS